LVQRWDADQGLGSWNLARLGVEQRKELPEDAWDDIKRVSMSFQSLEGMLFFLHETYFAAMQEIDISLQTVTNSAVVLAPANQRCSMTFQGAYLRGTTAFLVP
jgi:hypothetical protein